MSRRAYVLLAVFAAVVLVSFPTSGLLLYFRFQQGDATRQAILARDRNQNEALRAVLCYFEAQTLKSPNITPARRPKIVYVYEHALALIHAKPCG